MCYITSLCFIFYHYAGSRRVKARNGMCVLHYIIMSYIILSCVILSYYVLYYIIMCYILSLCVILSYYAGSSTTNEVFHAGFHRLLSIISCLGCAQANDAVNHQNDHERLKSKIEQLRIENFMFCKKLVMEIEKKQQDMDNLLKGLLKNN